MVDFVIFMLCSKLCNLRSNLAKNTWLNIWALANVKQVIVEPDLVKIIQMQPLYSQQKSHIYRHYITNWKQTVLRISVLKTLHSFILNLFLQFVRTLLIAGLTSLVLIIIVFYTIDINVYFCSGLPILWHGSWFTFDDIFIFYF